MTRALDLAPLLKYSIGYDDLFREMDKLMLNPGISQTYPPYNIFSTSPDDFYVEVAVAGFTETELDIKLENGILTVSGKKQETHDPSISYVHRGIGMRDFTRTFRLANHIEVQGAKLENGLLRVELKRIIPEELKPKRIAITSAQ
jgi:molecular chaperone IbpA